MMYWVSGTAVNRFSVINWWSVWGDEALCSLRVLDPTQLERIWTECEVAYAAGTKYRQLGGLKREINCLTVLETRSSKSRCQQEYLLLRTVGSPDPGLSGACSCIFLLSAFTSTCCSPHVCPVSTFPHCVRMEINWISTLLMTWF